MQATVPSLFQIAAFFEDFFPKHGGRRFVRKKNGHLPIAKYMLNPQRLMTLLRVKTNDVDVPRPVKNPVPAKKGGRVKRSQARNGNHGATGAEEVEGLIATLPRKVSFSYYAPEADCVELAGDFTSWEVEPIEMMHSADGTWFTVVPLMPGDYSYRFIVDGDWRDDPLSHCRLPNPFGTDNAVLSVA